MAPWMMVVATALVIAGVLAYVGVWRSWAFAKPVWSKAIGFGTLYLGIGIGLIFAADLLAPGRKPAWAVVLLAVGVLGILLGTVSLFWFPRLLTPRWYREVRAEQKKVHG